VRSTNDPTILSDILDITSRFRRNGVPLVGLGMNDEIREILAGLPPEISALVTVLQERVAILGAENSMLKQENALLLRNQDMIMKSHRELDEKVILLEEELKRRPS
jgi:uncharacterized protein YacL (UPF0231 family)